MKNITAEEKRLWLGSSHPKDLIITLTPPTQSGGTTITLTNTDIISESLEITQILESGKTLSFGDVNASSLKFKCRDLSTDIRGYKLEAVLKFKDYPQYSQKVFVGYVYNQTNQNHEDVTTTITAYDPIKTIFSLDLTEWWEDLTMADNTTFFYYCAQIINKLASEVGCGSFNSQDQGRLANLNQVIAKKPDLISDFQTISGEMLIKWIAQATNVYIQYDSATNKLKAVKLKLMGEALVPHIGLHPRVGLYPSAGVHDLNLPKAEYISTTYEPYKTERIDQVIITDKGEIGEGQYPVQEEQGDNVFFIDGNPFLWSMNMAECAETIYNRVHDVYFTPSTIKTSGTVFMELGDVVRVFTVKNVIQSYILKRTLKGINSIRDTFTNKSEQYQTSHNPSYADVTDLKTQSILRIQADIVEMNRIIASKATITDLDASNARIESLETDHVSTETITAMNTTINGKASVNDLNAVSAKVTTLEAKALTADNIDSKTFTLGQGHIKNLSSDYMEVKNWTSLIGTVRYINSDKIDANTIVANGLTVGKITSACNDASQGEIDIGTIKTSNYYYNTGNGYSRMSCSARVKYGGYTYAVLGYRV